MTNASPQCRGSVKRLTVLQLRCSVTHWRSPADECICNAKITSSASLAENLDLACMFILGISKLIFLVQQRDSKQTSSEKFQILEQIFESKPK